MQPSVQHALSWLAEGRLPRDPDAPTPEGDDLDRRARAIREALRGPTGEVLLQTILEMTLFRSPVDARLETPELYLRHAQMREGQNQVAATILYYLNHALDLERKADERRQRGQRSVGETPGASGDASAGPGGPYIFRGSTADPAEPDSGAAEPEWNDDIHTAIG
jgi:hypothetical protein